MRENEKEMDSKWNAMKIAHFAIKLLDGTLVLDSFVRNRVKYDYNHYKNNHSYGNVIIFCSNGVPIIFFSSFFLGEIHSRVKAAGKDLTFISLPPLDNTNGKSSYLNVKAGEKEWNKYRGVHQMRQLHCL